MLSPQAPPQAGLLRPALCLREPSVPGAERRRKRRWGSDRNAQAGGLVIALLTEHIGAVPVPRVPFPDATVLAAGLAPSGHTVLHPTVCLSLIFLVSCSRLP